LNEPNLEFLKRKIFAKKIVRDLPGRKEFKTGKAFGVLTFNDYSILLKRKEKSGLIKHPEQTGHIFCDVFYLYQFQRMIVHLSFPNVLIGNP
jgi:hypothetical protein